MQLFEVVVALLLGGAALAAVARRIGAPYPALVALAGAGLALIPGVPTLELDPELALALFVAPVLADAAFDASPRDLRANWRAVASLALGAVALTIAVVALVAKALVPDMPWGAAVALGAIVAPPDAAAATTVLKQLRPPNRLLVILEGESLFNDASALVVFAMTASRRAPEIMPARIRIPAWAVWEVAVFVLNVLAFILVSFQLKSIVERATGATGVRYAAIAAAVTAAAI